MPRVERGCMTCFNPRSREGSDGQNQMLVQLVTGFNPRSREGSDRVNANLFCLQKKGESFREPLRILLAKAILGKIEISIYLSMNSL